MLMLMLMEILKSMILWYEKVGRKALLVHTHCCCVCACVHVYTTQQKDSQRICIIETNFEVFFACGGEVCWWARPGGQRAQRVCVVCVWSLPHAGTDLIARVIILREVKIVFFFTGVGDIVYEEE